LGRASQQVVQSDVTAWGIAALVCGAVAVLAVNLGGLLPDPLVSALHATRAQGGNLSQIRGELAQVQAAAEMVAAATRTLETRFDLIDRTSTEMMRRVVAVEQSVPLLVEALPSGSDIDRSLLTASIGPAATERLQEIDGGLMLLTQLPLFPEAMVAEAPSQPLPALVEATGDAEDAAPESYAIVLGAGEDRQWAEARWDALSAEVGPLLLGLEPRILESRDGVSMMAGPFAAESGALTICARIEDVGESCTVGAFGGEPLFAGE